MKMSFRRTAIATALAMAMSLGVGGVAEATPASAPAAEAATVPAGLKAAPRAMWRWYGVGNYDVWRCNIFGAYYVNSGQARAYRCIPTGMFSAYLAVLIWY
ncbi:hypothetical protein ACFV2S_34475 [Streptomyces sp. NPDC059695]|uniref:hypothetical protein n=1 Tax=Streptomyces sp. NPDC059695 TaxID=3346910 RepID=UPI0036765B73